MSRKGIGAGCVGAVDDGDRVALVARVKQAPDEEDADEGEDEPWDRPDELVPSDLIDIVVGPNGLGPAADALGRSTCPVAPELLRAAG